MQLIPSKFQVQFGYLHNYRVGLPQTQKKTIDWGFIVLNTSRIHTLQNVVHICVLQTDMRPTVDWKTLFPTGLLQQGIIWRNPGEINYLRKQGIIIENNILKIHRLVWMLQLRVFTSHHRKMATLAFKHSRTV